MDVCHLGTTVQSPREMNRITIICFFLSLIITLISASPDHGGPTTSIIFTTLGRSVYAFDVFSLPGQGPSTTADELRITDGQSVNFNGYFPASPIISLLPNQTLIESSGAKRPDESLQTIYVTERNGSSNIYLDILYYYDDETPRNSRRRSALDTTVRIKIPLLGTNVEQSNGRISMKDRPSIVGEDLIYVSTLEDPGVPRKSWAAVYSTHLPTGSTKRLTPYGMADYSPAVSPSGVWTAVASYGEEGWDGEVQELSTDIYVFRTRDGSERTKVVERGGWPCWIDDSTLFFHRRGGDGWLSIYRAILTESVVIERVTPPGLHAFTPATSPGNKDFIAVATRRPDSDFRHIELFDLLRKEFRALTRPISPQTHHFNPFISPDSTRIGYHRCRGDSNGGKSPQLLLENLKSPLPEISLFRFEGSFPSFSPDGDRIAYVEFPAVYVVNRDGSGRRKVFSGEAFSTAWDRKRKGIVYTNAGPTFATESTEVDILSINVDDVEQPSYKKLTTDGKNNAFPSPSPDGKWIVFRSGRSGHKNLYIMDAVYGERGGIHRLTEGAWTDTMCNWSPDGDWIAFASDRENPGSGGFELFIIHPNGTGLRKVVQSGSAGRTNHPWFSPDGKSIVFTSDYAAISAEPISTSHQYQPYGEIFVVNLDGTGLHRLTHNSYEDGTPAWAPNALRPVDVKLPADDPHCSFEDCYWLSNTPKHGVEPAPRLFAKPRCGMQA